MLIHDFVGISIGSPYWKAVRQRRSYAVGLGAEENVHVYNPRGHFGCSLPDPLLLGRVKISVSEDHTLGLAGYLPQREAVLGQRDLVEADLLHG